MSCALGSVTTSSPTSPAWPTRHNPFSRGVESDDPTLLNTEHPGLTLRFGRLVWYDNL